MRGILQIYNSFFGKLTAFMVFSFFVPGCHTGSEPASVPPGPVKKEDTNYNQAKRIQAESIVKTPKKKPETPADHSASGILLPEKQKNKTRRIYSASHNDKNPDSASRRDPFALPAALRKQQSVAQGQQPFTRGQNNLQASPQHASLQQTAVSPGSQEPCVAGIFDNGKEKIALLHWQQIQGVFRCGEHLGNGYYVKEISAAAVSLYPEKNGAGIKPVTLTLH